jgi:uncharacterized membrane protein SpoIIM required for sporulation
MIIDLPRFVASERPYWDELEGLLEKMETDHQFSPDLAQARRFHYLYQRASADLCQISAFAVEPATRRYLESLVARAYGEINETRRGERKIRLVHWFVSVFPTVFRRRIGAFCVSLGLTVAGVAFGAAAIAIDPGAKPVLLPFPHLQGKPSERVAWEERHHGDEMSGRKAQFSTTLMTHNIQVSITALAMGMTFGFGTLVLLFYNGVILGAVSADYILDGQGKFLCGWLLPHGVIEIPAILVAGQAAFVLAQALIGHGASVPLAARFRRVVPDVVTLAYGLAVMLVWAGIMEAFFSQYHEPVLPYAVKISIGLAEFGGLCLLLTAGGRGWMETEAGS